MKPFFIVLLLAGFSVLGQSVKGIVTDTEGAPLIGASVFWQGTSTGVLTNAIGQFTLPASSADYFVVSYVGYTADTIRMQSSTSFYRIQLELSDALDEVEVTASQSGTTIDFLSPAKSEVISEKELLKAACCNLSESFETNASVDVSFTDAVTGTRQIEMLGLSSRYSQITRESMPDIRGLSTFFGLTYIPGTWIESIQLNKGAGSVVNGYESITGQINVELKKPRTMDRFFANGYVNQMGRTEINLDGKTTLGPLNSALFVHGSIMPLINDMNNDGFADQPTGTNLTLLNRWQTASENGWVSQFNIKATVIDQEGGQVQFLEGANGNFWGMNAQTRRYEAWGKLGKVFPTQPYRSFGLQLSGVWHDYDSHFGNVSYMGNERYFYANLIYQDIIGNTNHSYKSGISYTLNDQDQRLSGVNYDFIESVPGAFFEYSYAYLEKFSLVAGIRGDYHNLYGAFVTPRLHMRWQLTDQDVLRASGGRGLRTPQLIVENIGLLSTSRNWNILGEDPDLPYGVEPEVAWNFGLNYSHYFTLDFREGIISVDLYRTDFINQLVVDRDADEQNVYFYNLTGQSYANAVQLQIDYELIKRLHTRWAYRYYDVRTTIGDRLRAQPLVPSHRGFVNLEYTTRNYWAFDLTTHITGQQRLPDAFYQDENAPAFFLVNGQISKKWNNNNFMVYVGVENLLNFRQNDPIISADQPFGPYFDASMVWGPIFGRNIYTGIRLNFP